MFKDLQKELNEKGFNLTYHLGKEKYIITKKGDILNKLSFYKEGLMDRTSDDIIYEYNKMVKYFNDTEAFINKVKTKSIKELSLKEFEKIKRLEIQHPEVINAYNIYWNNLSFDEKKKIRRLTDGMDADYTGIADYVYQMALNQ
ncbi:MAG: hypothetical protein IJH34_10095 [Romboutsia sp.]|nr:hypothetical protein [Romboutsia sp.]